MHEVPSVIVLEELFEEAWQTADLAAASDDRHLVPRLLAMADDVLVWRNRRIRDAAKTTAAADLLAPSPGRSSSEAVHGERLRRMEVLLAQQRAVVVKVEQRGDTLSAEPAHDLLSAMEAAVAMVRHAAATRALAGVPSRPR